MNNDFNNDWNMDEIPYTPEEKLAVWGELTRGLFLGEIHNGISKRELKDWFASISMQHFGEFCPNITGNDLAEIANEFGLEVRE